MNWYKCGVRNECKIMQRISERKNAWFLHTAAAAAVAVAPLIGMCNRNNTNVWWESRIWIALNFFTILDCISIERERHVLSVNN